MRAARFEGAGYSFSPDDTKSVLVCHVCKFAADQSSPEMLRQWK